MSKSKLVAFVVFIAASCMLTITAQAQVGIGTSLPIGKLHILHAGPSGHLIVEYPGLNNYSRLLFTNTGASRYWGIAGKISSGTNVADILSLYNSSNATDVIAMTGNGYVGIGVPNPANKFQIGSVGSTGFATNDFAIGNGTNAIAIQQSNTSTLIGSTTDISIMPKNDGNGNLGINVATPANKFQIGSVGSTGFATNDLAIGNGTSAMAISQTNTETLIGSTTDIILKPRNNGLGRVGINTNTPGYPLEVMGTNASGNADYSYLNFLSYSNGINRCNGCYANISIRAGGTVYAAEFDAFSDARIKNILGVSNSAKDLEVINALQITDYTLKDKVMNGNKLYKKVIAQEVEKVYPQVVSTHTDFIPNVYLVSSKVEKTSGGYLVSFVARHNISKAAKKLRVLVAEGEGMQQFDIVVIPSDNQVVINATGLKSDKLFVYGEQVEDFRTIDYEGLSTLNISATQELSKLLKAQQSSINALIEEIKVLKEKANVVNL